MKSYEISCKLQQQQQTSFFTTKPDHTGIARMSFIWIHHVIVTIYWEWSCAKGVGEHTEMNKSNKNKSNNQKKEKIQMEYLELVIWFFLSFSLLLVLINYPILNVVDTSNIMCGFLLRLDVVGTLICMYIHRWIIFVG